MHLTNSQLGHNNSTYQTNVPLIRFQRCTTSHRLRSVRLGITANINLNTNAAISIRGLQLSFGGGGSRKQVN